MHTPDQVYYGLDSRLPNKEKWSLKLFGAIRKSRDKKEKFSGFGSLKHREGLARSKFQTAGIFFCVD